MEEIAKDSLIDPIYIYSYHQLEDVVIKLEAAQQQNNLLMTAIIVLVLAFAIFCWWLIKRHRTKIRMERLVNRLLAKQAHSLPDFTEKINKLSAKGIKLSGGLYDEFQDAIDTVKRAQKEGIAEIVNDIEFARHYPFLQDFGNLSAQEKLVLILTEEEHSNKEIALLLGVTSNTVRAVKTKLKGKLMQSENIAKHSKRLKILKK